MRTFIDTIFPLWIGSYILSSGIALVIYSGFYTQQQRDKFCTLTGKAEYSGTLVLNLYHLPVRGFICAISYPLKKD